MEWKAAVIGVGTMGSGIAQSILEAGHRVVMISRSEESSKAGFERVSAGIDKAIAKGSIKIDGKEELLKRISISAKMEDIADADLIIEAVAEEIKVKEEVLKNGELYARNDAIISTNTSSISIGLLATALSTPERFLGLHFFNPAPVMKVVEVVSCIKTGGSSIEKAKKFIADIGKKAVEVKDSPGFISNRLLMPFINDSIKMLEEGIADKEGIDDVARLGLNHPMGPLQLADFIGLDVCLDIMKAIYEQNSDSRFIPAEMLKELVKNGKLGRKSGSGFYNYNI